MNGKYLHVSDHAIRRFRSRIGRKHATKERLRDFIRAQVVISMQEKRYTELTQSAGSLQNRSVYRVFTPTFVAITTRKRILTIEPKQGGASHANKSKHRPEVQP